MKCHLCHRDVDKVSSTLKGPACDDCCDKYGLLHDAAMLEREVREESRVVDWEDE